MQRQAMGVEAEEFLGWVLLLILWNKKEKLTYLLFCMSSKHFESLKKACGDCHKEVTEAFYTNVLNVLLSTEKNSSNLYSNIFREIIR